MKTLTPCLTSAALLSAWLTGAAVSQESALQPLTADDLAFSVENMDRSVDPAEDFYRYASGGWLDRVERPADKASWGIFQVIGERLTKQMAQAAARAGEEAGDAEKGSPEQLVGDFYNAFMNLEAIDAAGIEPIREDLDRIEAISSLEDLTRFMAEQAIMSGPALFAIFVPTNDPADSKRYAMFATGQTFGLDKHYVEILRRPENNPSLEAYRSYVSDVMKVAGYPAEEADRIADTTVRIETALYSGFLTPEEGNDPRNRYTRKSFAEVQGLIPELDMSLYFEIIGFEKPDALYMFEPRAIQAAAKVWRETPLNDLKDYAAFRVINEFSPFLTSKFVEPTRTFNAALTGAREERPRQERIYELLKDNLGHPASRIYVDAYYPEQTRDEVTDMVRRIHAVFRKRVETRDWLSEETRAEALRKVDNFYFKVGYPNTWVDYTKVDIGPDPVANMTNLGAFSMQRLVEKLKHPVVHDEFNTPSTLPIVINAAYEPAINGFEVAAAITQPPAYSSDMDAPLRFCRIGAVIGHEMTHGFDSGGRRYDSSGNFRDWWTPSDAAAFEAEAQKLIDQANAFEVLPGLMANGELNKRENMADVGGINFAYAALMDYLAEHPEEDVEIDGMTPAERCFVGWAQMWTSKDSEQFLRMIVAGDGHPPSPYRAVSALQHVDAFYETFDIKDGDPMWLPPEKRVRAW